MNNQSPSVTRLQVHLPEQQGVIYSEKADLKTIVRKNANTQLTDYFNLNARDPQARELAYCDIPKYYTWNRSKKQWNRRKK
jgi:hypothetical protein